MDIKRLKHLVALAEERNFGRAAERVHLSQPAFSRSVQNAEAELGLQLFDRGSLEVSCTSAGSFVIERARKLLFDSRCLERDVSLYRERLIGDLAFGVGPFPAATLVPLFSFATCLRSSLAARWWEPQPIYFSARRKSRSSTKITIRFLRQRLLQACNTSSTPPSTRPEG